MSHTLSAPGEARERRSTLAGFRLTLSSAAWQNVILDSVMRADIEDYLLNPPSGSAAARAAEFGIDLTLTLENLRLSPEERIRKLDDFIEEDIVSHLKRQNRWVLEIETLTGCALKMIFSVQPRCSLCLCGWFFSAIVKPGTVEQETLRAKLL